MVDDPKTLVSGGWLAARLDDSNVRILDASWYLPAMNRDAEVEFAKAHIPGAQRIDIDAVSDQSSDLPHMAPDAAQFSATLGAMGISNDTQVVVYDGMGVFAAARVWWMLKLIGHDAVAVLNGGLPKWTAEGRPVTTELRVPEPAVFSAAPRHNLVRDVSDVLAALDDPAIDLLDARPAERFAGTVAEPREGMRSGHMPGALNLPFPDLMSEDGLMKSGDDLRAAFEIAGVDFDRKIITTCGSGVTAAILALGLSRLGFNDWALYDGSWSEWGARTDLPLATGDA